jgi:hypothetical protein
MPIIQDTWEAEAGRSQVQWQGKGHSETLSEKQNKNKRAGYVARVVEHLPSKHKALGKKTDAHNFPEMKEGVQGTLANPWEEDMSHLLYICRKKREAHTHLYWFTFCS